MSGLLANTNRTIQYIELLGIGNAYDYATSKRTPAL